MDKHETDSPKDIALKAQRASAITRALSYSWLELPGCDIEVLFGVILEYTDSVTEHLINLPSGSAGETPAIGDRYISNDGGMMAVIRDVTSDRVMFSFEQYPEASHEYSLRGFIREFTFVGRPNHA